MQLEMKCISDGTKLNERFRSEDKMEKAFIEPRNMQYLYMDGINYVFMDMESFEQITMTGDDLQEQVPFLMPNIPVQINFHSGMPVAVELPASVILEVVETESVVKGQTASGSGKPAVLETGHRVTVPTFINVGEKVKVNTDNGEYIERA